MSSGWNYHLSKEGPGLKCLAPVIPTKVQIPNVTEDHHRNDTDSPRYKPHSQHYPIKDNKGRTRKDTRHARKESGLFNDGLSQCVCSVVTCNVNHQGSLSNRR